jgi:hypothetical protein
VLCIAYCGIVLNYRLVSRGGGFTLQGAASACHGLPKLIAHLTKHEGLPVRLTRPGPATVLEAAATQVSPPGADLLLDGAVGR